MKYRELEVGEIVQEGDEWQPYPDTWWKSSRVGYRVVDGHYRRPITEEVPDCGEGYRLLKQGEKVIGTDEFYGRSSGRWCPTVVNGFTIGKGQIAAGIFYRRRLAVRPEPCVTGSWELNFEFMRNWQFTVHDNSVHITNEVAAIKVIDNPQEADKLIQFLQDYKKYVLEKANGVG
jgi:hypothetical protein